MFYLVSVVVIGELQIIVNTVALTPVANIHPKTQDGSHIEFFVLYLMGSND